MADGSLIGGGGGDELAGASVIGGAVVRISGDVSQLEAAEKNAQQITARIESRGAAVKLVGDVDVRTIVSSLDALRAGQASKPMIIVARLDEQALLKQSEQLIVRVQNQWANVRLAPRIDVGAGDESPAQRATGPVWTMAREIGPRLADGRFRSSEAVADMGSNPGWRSVRNSMGEEAYDRSRHGGAFGGGGEIGPRMANGAFRSGDGREQEELTRSTQRLAEAIERSGGGNRVASGALDNRLSVIQQEVDNARLRKADAPESDAQPAKVVGTGMMGRIIGGMAVREGIHAIEGLPEYNRQLIEAGNDQDAILKAELARRDQLTSTVIGGIVGFLQDPTGSERAGVDLTIRSKDDQQNYGKIIASQKEQLLLEKERSSVAVAGDPYSGRAIANENQLEDTKRKIGREKDAADLEISKNHQTALSLAEADEPSIWHGVLDSVTGGRGWSIAERKYQNEVAAADKAADSQKLDNENVSKQRIAAAQAEHDAQALVIGGQKAARAEGMNARIVAADQGISGHSIESSYTPRISEKLQEVMTAAPNDLAQTKTATIKELQEMEKGLTGGHGGGIAEGSTDNGATLAKIFAARARGPQEQMIRNQIHEAEQQIGALQPGGKVAGPAGASATAVAAQHDQHGGAHPDSHRSKYGQIAYEQNMKKKAAAAHGPHGTIVSKEAHAPAHATIGKDHRDPGYSGMRTELGDAIMGADGNYHVKSSTGHGMGGTLTPEQYKNLRAAEKTNAGDVGKKTTATAAQRRAVAGDGGGVSSIDNWKRGRVEGPDSIEKRDLSASWRTQESADRITAHNRAHPDQLLAGGIMPTPSAGKMQRAVAAAQPQNAQSIAAAPSPHSSVPIDSVSSHLKDLMRKVETMVGHMATVAKHKDSPALLH
jgi:hypothetical protein